MAGCSPLRFCFVLTASRCRRGRGARIAGAATERARRRRSHVRVRARTGLRYARSGAFTDFEVMLADLSRADVVLVGEQHDDPNTHRLEAALLEGLLRRRAALVVSLEMFERDVQPALDAYLGGRNTEEEFLKASRPWPRYATDYRPLVELAKVQTWPVIAANVPRRVASDIARNGLAPLASLPAPERAFVAADLQCPKDAYFDRFAATMGEHPGSAVGRDRRPPGQQATIERYYQSQCAKDETMAESIAASFARRGSAHRPDRPLHRCVPQRLRHRHRRARPPPAARPSGRDRHARAARHARRRRTFRRRSQTCGVPDLHGQVGRSERRSAIGGRRSGFGDRRSASAIATSLSECCGECPRRPGLKVGPIFSRSGISAVT